MSLETLPPPAPGLDDDAEGEGLDLGALRDYLALLLLAIRKHLVIATATAIVIFSLVVFVATGMPRTYNVSTTILIQGDRHLGPLATGHFEPENATKGVTEMVLRRDNLIAIIRETNLIARWKETRSPLQSLKDRVYAALGRQLSDEEFADALVYTLERRILAYSGEQTVTIEVNWHDPFDAYRIAAAAQQNFLEARQLAETSAITDSISILESHLAEAGQETERVLSVARDVRRARKTAAPQTPAASPSPVAAPPDPELIRARAQLE